MGGTFAIYKLTVAFISDVVEGSVEQK
jgi:hypothetical protein